MSDAAIEVGVPPDGHGSSTMANCTMVCGVATNVHNTGGTIATETPTTALTRETGQRAPPTQPNETNMCSYIRQALARSNLSEDAKLAILQAWRPRTQKQYGGYMARWVEFAMQKQTDPFDPSVNIIVNFECPNGSA